MLYIILRYGSCGRLLGAGVRRKAEAAKAAVTYAIAEMAAMVGLDESAVLGFAKLDVELPAFGGGLPVLKNYTLPGHGESWDPCIVCIAAKDTYQHRKGLRHEQ